MRTAQKNGRKFRSVYTLLRRTGQGVKFATDTGYKTGYFMAKHPGIQYTKEQIQKNYKAGLVALLGVGITLFGILQVIAKLRK